MQDAGCYRAAMAISNEPGGFAGIQYLRGIAAMMVVLHHAPRGGVDWLAGTDFGSRGVEVFFVISGFIMAHTTCNLAQGRPAQALAFLKKRLIRVAPLYWIALTWVAMPMLLNRGPNLDLLLDYCFIPHWIERYPGHVFPLLVPGWSLNYEMFFYLLFGVGILFGRWKSAFVLVTLGALYVLGRTGSPASAAGVFYTASDVLFFAAGVLVHRLHVCRPGVAWSPATGLAAVLAGAVLLALDGSGSGVLLHTTGAGLVVYAGVVCLGRWHWMALGTLGDASYAVYLFHAPALRKRPANPT